jgi:hypothetical protein
MKYPPARARPSQLKNSISLVVLALAASPQVVLQVLPPRAARVSATLKSDSVPARGPETGFEAVGRITNGKSACRLSFRFLTRSAFVGTNPGGITSGLPVST